MSLLDALKSALPGGDGPGPETAFECLSCGATFESANPVAKVSCSRCGNRNFRER